MGLSLVNQARRRELESIFPKDWRGTIQCDGYTVYPPVRKLSPAEFKKLAAVHGFRDR